MTVELDLEMNDGCAVSSVQGPGFLQMLPLTNVQI